MLWKWFQIILCLIFFTPQLVHLALLPQNATQKMYSNLRGFTFELYKVLSKEKGNFVSFPYGVTVSLAMMSSGAVGETSNEIRKVLHYDDQSYFDENVATEAYAADARERRGNKINPYLTGNSLWFQKDVELYPQYFSLINQRFLVQVKELDFTKPSANAILNQWASTETMGRIERVISEEPLIESFQRPKPFFVIANVAYFNLLFVPEDDLFMTKLIPFTQFAEDGIAIKRVQPMMFFKGRFQHGWSRYLDDDYQLVEIPYMNGRYGLVIVLPNKLNGIKELDKKLTNDIETDIYSMKENDNIVIGVPEFNISSVLRLASSSKTLGVQKAFHFGEANFSKMTSNPHAYAREILHSAKVVVHSQVGDEPRLQLNDPSSTRVIVDHPFIFLIRDRHKNLNLFIGRVDYT